MEVFGRLADRESLAPWWPLTAVGLAAFVVSLWNFTREVATIGLELGPVLAAAMGTSLAASVLYVGVRLGRSDLDERERWVVVTAGLGGGFVFTASQALTFAIRAVEGRSVSEPLLPVLVVGGLGTLVGVLVGRNYVAAERGRRTAERSRDAMAFTNSLLRHDVRNALQVVAAHIERLADHDDEEVVESARSIRSQTDSIETLLTEVESLSSVLTGELETEPVDLVDVLASVSEGVADSFEAATVDTDLPDGLVVEGAEVLYPVFDNLVKNAVKHTPSDDVRIDVTAKAGDDVGVTRVADDGPGIPEDDRERVFESGVSSDSGGHGLYVAQTIVETLDGDIRVEESDLGGAAFVVELPLRDEQEDRSDDPFGG